MPRRLEEEGGNQRSVCTLYKRLRFSLKTGKQNCKQLTQAAMGVSSSHPLLIKKMVQGSGWDARDVEFLGGSFKDVSSTLLSKGNDLSLSS